MIYEWDEAKRLKNLEKHGIDLIRGVQVYEAECKVTLESHRSHENRWMDIAGIDGVIMVLSLTYTRRKDTVRFISLRPASRKERRIYQWEKSSDTPAKS